MTALTRVVKNIGLTDRRRPEIMDLIALAQSYEQAWENASNACNKVAGQRDKYKAALENFVANAYEQSHGASDYVVTTCEALEAATKVLAEKP